MNLVLYRMEDTERIRFKLREKRRQEIREKAAKDEENEKERMDRMERNRKWRDRKLGRESFESLLEEKTQDEREERRIKNKEWRERRVHLKTRENEERKENLSQSLEQEILPELECPYCQVEMRPPTKIYQCQEGHNLCQHCKERRGMKVSYL